MTKTNAEFFKESRSQTYQVLFFSHTCSRYRTKKHTELEHQVAQCTFQKWLWKSWGKKWQFQVIFFTLYNDTSHYILSLCAGSSVTPSSSFAIRGTTRRAKEERRQQSCSSLNIFHHIFISLSYYRSVWSEHCIHLAEIQLFHGWVRTYFKVTATVGEIFIRLHNIKYSKPK